MENRKQVPMLYPDQEQDQTKLDQLKTRIEQLTEQKLLFCDLYSIEKKLDEAPEEKIKTQELLIGDLFTCLENTIIKIGESQLEYERLKNRIDTKKEQIEHLKKWLNCFWMTATGNQLVPSIEQGSLASLQTLVSADFYYKLPNPSVVSVYHKLKGNEDLAKELGPITEYLELKSGLVFYYLVINEKLLREVHDPEETNSLIITIDTMINTNNIASQLYSVRLQKQTENKADEDYKDIERQYAEFFEPLKDVARKVENFSSQITKFNEQLALFSNDQIQSEFDYLKKIKEGVLKSLVLKEKLKEFSDKRKKYEEDYGQPKRYEVMSKRVGNESFDVFKKILNASIEQLNRLLHMDCHFDTTQSKSIVECAKKYENFIELCFNKLSQIIHETQEKRENERLANEQRIKEQQEKERIAKEQEALSSQQEEQKSISEHRGHSPIKIQGLDELKNLINELKNQAESLKTQYRLASVTAQQLGDYLSAQCIELEKNPSQINTFRKNCGEQIDKSKGFLEIHSGLQSILAKIANVISVIFIVGIAQYCKTGHGFFNETKTLINVTPVKDKVENVTCLHKQ